MNNTSSSPLLIYNNLQNRRLRILGRAVSGNAKGERKESASSSRVPNPQRYNAARVRNMNRFDGGISPGEIQNTFSKRQKIKQFLEREALNVEYL